MNLNVSDLCRQAQAANLDVLHRRCDGLVETRGGGELLIYACACTCHSRDKALVAA